MDFKDAVERVNKIDWDLFGNIDIKKRGLVGEYLKRLAKFFDENSFEPMHPLFTDISFLLGNKREINISDYCPPKVLGALEHSRCVRRILEYYLELAYYSDIYNKYKVYLEIYEPLIQLIEMGGDFAFREGGIMIYRGAYYPLNGWYKLYLELNYTS